MSGALQYLAGTSSSSSSDSPGCQLQQLLQQQHGSPTAAGPSRGSSQYRRRCRCRALHASTSGHPGQCSGTAVASLLLLQLLLVEVLVAVLRQLPPQQQCQLLPKDVQGQPGHPSSPGRGWQAARQGLGLLQGGCRHSSVRVVRPGQQQGQGWGAAAAAAAQPGRWLSCGCPLRELCWCLGMRRHHRHRQSGECR